MQGNLCANSTEVESSVEEDYEALWPFRCLSDFCQDLRPPAYRTGISTAPCVAKLFSVGFLVWLLAFVA